jgi:hypothetical protein
VFEKAEIFGTVNSRPRTLAERRWLDQLMMACRKPLEQSIRAFGLLRGALHDAPHQKKLRIVAAVTFGIDRFQDEPRYCGPDSGWFGRGNIPPQACGFNPESRQHLSTAVRLRAPLASLLCDVASRLKSSSAALQTIGSQPARQGVAFGTVSAYRLMNGAGADRQQCGAWSTRKQTSVVT